MAAVRPLKLKQEQFRPTLPAASNLPFALVLVDHQVVHLGQEYEYVIPEVLSEAAVVGALVEVEFGRSLTQGVIVERRAEPTSAGALKDIRKVLSREPYVKADQIALINAAANLYGTNPWDFIRTCIPPFSKGGEREFITAPERRKISHPESKALPTSLTEFLAKRERFTCAILLPSSTPYWDLIAEISIVRAEFGTVLLLLANERELDLISRALLNRGVEPLGIIATQGKSRRYRNYLISRSYNGGIILGLRSASLTSLPTIMQSCTIIVLDDVDESHYERQSPTWNTRELIRLREEDHSVIYASSTVSLEISARILQGALPIYRFPAPESPKFRSASSTREADYFPLISQGLLTGSVLICVGGSGYVTSFSCQQCRNIALCECGGKLFFPTRGSTPRCSTCTSEFLEWSCSWCHSTKTRVVRSGVAHKAEEFGRSFPRHSVIQSSAQNPIAELPSGSHLVISTPGMEPRGSYSTIIFLELEGRLMRTALKASEELRLQIFRALSMLVKGGEVYLDLPPDDTFLQSILRNNPLMAAERELEARGAADFLPAAINIVITGEILDQAKRLVSDIEGVEVVGPFLRAGKKSALIKAPLARREELIELLRSLNRVQSMRKKGLLTYQINPYSLN